MLYYYVKHISSRAPNRSLRFLHENAHIWQREYFYCLDTRGQLFLADSPAKNIATSLKDQSFLRLFYSNLRQLEKDWKTSLCSPCGRELNHLVVDDAVAVLVFVESTYMPSTSHDEVKLLQIGQSPLTHAFNPNALAISLETGRLYHRISEHRHLKGAYGLLHPALLEKLSSQIQIQGEDVQYHHAGNGKLHPVHVLR
jgi:hypothetical protein